MVQRTVQVAQGTSPDPALDSAEGAAGEQAPPAARPVGLRRYRDTSAVVAGLVIALGISLGVLAFSTLADLCGR